MNARRVAIFEPYVLDRAYGNQKYLLGLVKHLDPGRYEPIVVSPTESPFVDSLGSSGVSVAVVRAPERLNRYGGSLLASGVLDKAATGCSIARFSRSLCRFLNDADIDLVHCNNLRGVIMSAWAARYLRKPLVWYVKGQLDNPLIDGVGFRVADRVLFQSRTNLLRRYPGLRTRFASKMAIVPNGVDLEDIDAAATVTSSLAKELELTRDTFNVAYLGQVSPHKGTHVLTEAMARLSRAIPRARLFISGDHGTPEYESYASELRRRTLQAMDGRVSFLGYRRDVVSVLSLMDLLVLPSFAEGFPRSVMEAMALGKPVVATRVGGVPDLVRHGVTGYVVEPGNPEALADAIRRLADDSDLCRRFGERGRTYVRRHHAFARSARELMSVYDGLFTERGPSRSPSSARLGARRSR